MTTAPHTIPSARRGCVLVVALLIAGVAGAVVDVYQPIADGVNVILQNGRSLFIECSLPRGRSAAQSMLKSVLIEDIDARPYSGKRRVAIPFNHVRPEFQRAALLASFPEDYVDARGWLHKVRFAGDGQRQGQETLWSLSEWLTGNGFSQTRIAEINRLPQRSLQAGQVILFPADMLIPIMRRPTPNRTPLPTPRGVSEAPASPTPAPAPLPLTPPADNGNGLATEFHDDPDTLLSFGEDAEGPYALYTLRPGDASLYTPVVVRFTDYRENADILEACDIIQQRSGIRDVHDMEIGQPVKIPMYMLSARYQPKGSDARAQYEATLREAERIRRDHVSARDLDGVVVILDPGHGGADPGADGRKLGISLIEDEINYDIAVRIREILLRETRAKVYMTLRDRSQGFTPTNATRFTHDEDEELTTTPPYNNAVSKYSLNLRSQIAAHIYREETAAGVDPRKILFTSIHCDALFNAQLRGAMIYIPGWQYRKDEETHEPASFYNQFAEARGHLAFRTTASDRRRDEAVSRGFAEVLMETFGKHRVRRHLESEPIRSVIRRSRTQTYLPAVLRNNPVPTKVLVEVANMTNPTDCERIADPEWRQLVAVAYVNALRDFYGP